MSGKGEWIRFHMFRVIYKASDILIFCGVTLKKIYLFSSSFISYFSLFDKNKLMIKILWMLLFGPVGSKEIMKNDSELWKINTTTYWNNKQIFKWTCNDTILKLMWNKSKGIRLHMIFIYFLWNDLKQNKTQIWLKFVPQTCFTNDN